MTESEAKPKTKDELYAEWCAARGVSAAAERAAWEALQAAENPEAPQSPPEPQNSPAAPAEKAKRTK